MVTLMPLPHAALLIISIETGRVKGEKRNCLSSVNNDKMLVEAIHT